MNAVPNPSVVYLPHAGRLFPDHQAIIDHFMGQAMVSVERTVIGDAHGYFPGGHVDHAWPTMTDGYKLNHHRDDDAKTAVEKATYSRKRKQRTMRKNRK
jgi:hypothetical protein